MAAEPTITPLAVPFSSMLGAAGSALRHAVFVLEQNVPEEHERDAYDAGAIHVVAIAEGDVVGVLRIVDMGEHAKIGRVAVRKDWRGRGVARTMMQYAMDLSRRNGQPRFYLSAQRDALGLYEKLGFSAFGEPFVEAGIDHVAMKTY
jgi:predicted GNAT family N-acyltransferase